MTTPDTPETAPVAATRADRERLAAYYRHPLVANPSRAEAVLADDWLSGASYAEIAMLETLARHRTANETAPPARSVRTRPKEVSMTVSKPETVEVTQALEPCSKCRFVTGPLRYEEPESFLIGCKCWSNWYPTSDAAVEAWQERHRLNATPSRQDGLREALEKIELLRDLADDTLMEAGAVRYNAGDIEKVQDALIDMGSTARDAIDVLAALSDTPPPDNEEPWPGCFADLQRRRVETLAKLGLMLSLMAGGEAAEVIGYDAADLYAEVLMALAIEDADDPDIALEEARDHPESDTLLSAFNNGGK